MIFTANSPVGLRQLPKSKPIGNVSPSLLSNFPQGGTSLLSNQQRLKNQRTKAFKDLNKFLKSVIEQEKKKKYETRLWSHDVFYH